MAQQHTGRPTVRISKDGKVVYMLCPVGHFVTSIEMKNYAGSWFEANAGDPNYEVSCNGTMPSPSND